MKPSPGTRAIVAIAIAAALIATLSIVAWARTSGSARSPSESVSHDPGVGTSPSFGTTPPTPTSTTTTKAGEEPMYGSQASISNISTVNTGSGEVEISGTTGAGAKVTVNGEPVAVRGDGSWTVRVRTGRGPTAVNVVAVSADGSSRSSSSVTVSG